MAAPSPVAIIGMSCRFPGASCPEELEQLLLNGVSSWGPIPADRWNREAFHHAQQGAAESLAATHGYFLKDDISKFDARFFQVPPQEAHAMDPQQRILLQTTYEALENAGLPLEDVRGSNTSVFISAFAYDYQRMGYKDLAEVSGSHVAGTGMAMLSNRISYVFDLTGASLTLDTGCSGSLVCLHQACQSLRLGESDMAIVGGSQLLLDPAQSVNMSAIGMVNPDGHCYAFDTRGNGYARGEGVATVVLKLLDKALADGDPVHGVIVGSGINQDGRTAGSIMSPSGEAQRVLIQEVYAKAGLDPSQTPYVEAHGTGTKIGDKEEIGSIYSVFCKDRNREKDLYVGSVKSNIGHLEASAGIAGLIKSILVLKTGVIPPQLNLIEPKPSLKLEERNIKIAREATPLPQGPRRVSLNSFGYGGTNCHVIIEDLSTCTASGRGLELGPRNDGARATNGRAAGTSSEIRANGNINGITAHGVNISGPQLFLLSANSEKALKASAHNVLQWLSSHSSSSRSDSQAQKALLDDLAYTHAARRSLLTWRAGIVASDVGQLSSSLASVRPSKSSSAPHMAFVFTGQGSQWAGMGRELMSLAPFEESIMKSEKTLQGLGASAQGWSLCEQLCADDKSSRLGDAKIAQPVTTCLQIALVDLLRSLGVELSTVVGHSSGEVGAAYAAGALSHEAAVQVSYFRGFCAAQAKKDQTTTGSMLAVGLGEDAVHPYVAQTKTGRICVACVNSPESTTISGDECAIDELKALLDAQSIFARKLRVDQAYHSHHMHKATAAYLSSTTHMQSGPVREGTSFFSTVTGVSKKDGFGAQYWVDNLVSPVQFVKGLRLVRDEMKQADTGGDDAFILVEIGPAPTLAGPTKQTLASPDFKFSYLCPLVRKTDGRQSTLTFLGHLVEMGVSVDRKKLSSMLSGHGGDHVPRTIPDLKAYPFAEDSLPYWRESRVSSAHRLRQFAWHDLCGLLDPTGSEQEPRWRHHLNVNKLPWLRDHVIDGSIIFPAAGCVCMVIEAMKQLAWVRKSKAAVPGSDNPAQRFRVSDVNFAKAISLPVDQENASIELQLTISPCKAGGGRWEAFRILMYSEGAWEESCSGLVGLDDTQDNNNIEAVSEHDLQDSAYQVAFRGIQQDCTSAEAVVGGDKFYQNLKATGNLYGPSFALLGDLHIGTDQTMAWTKLVVPDLPSLMSGYSPQPHLVHPSSLDAISHIGAHLFKLHNGNAPVVVGSVADMEIRADMSNSLSEPNTELYVAATLNRSLTDKRSCTTDAYVFQKNSTSGELSLVIKACYVLRSFGLGQHAALADEASSQGKQPRRVKWDVDVDFLSNEKFMYMVAQTQQKQQAQSPSQKGFDEGFNNYYYNIEQAASIFIRHALSKLDITTSTPGTVTPPSVAAPHLQKLFSWMQEYSTSPAFQALTSDLNFEDEARVVAAAEDATSFGFEGKMAARVGRKLANILLGKCDSLTLMREGDLLDSLYANGISSSSYQQMAEYVRLLAFKKPHMRILEIGAGTGGATMPLLQALRGQNGEIWLDRYAYTDISGGFFDHAKAKFAEWLGYIDFGVLDIEKDPTTQGYEAGSYDVVLAVNVLHATKNMNATIAQARKLLRPGGKLIVVELTKLCVAVNIVFGTLPGWWAFEDERLGHCPLLTTSGWDDLLRRHGFSGLDICAQNTQSQESGISSLMVSSVTTETALELPPSPPSSSPLAGVRIIQGFKDSPSIRRLTASLLEASKLRGYPGWACLDLIKDAEELQLNSADPVLVLDVAEHGLLLNESPEIFDALRSLLTAGSHVLWVSLQETRDDAAISAKRSMIQGTARVLRRENGGESRLITIDVDETTALGDVTVVRDLCSRLLEAAQASMSGGDDSYERELRYSNGELLIPRLQTDSKFQAWSDRRSMATSAPNVLPLESDVPYHQPGRPLKLDVGVPGLLGSLRFVDDGSSSSKIQLKPWEIEISARAHGVNFKDVFVALGQMRAGVNMVGEVAGVVTGVGEDMRSRYKNGDRVLGFGASPFASQPRISGHLAHALPPDMSFTAGATIPVVYATAYYSLFEAAQFKKGQTILIPAATGGVGQAAIQLAQHAGASEIFVTVGSQAKKQLVMDTYGIPESHVFSSRAVSFKEGILRHTKGRGVDCVLNSLSGEMLSEAFDCVAKLGTFVEIGKTDIYKGNHIRMSNFDKSITFASVDLVTLGAEQPRVVYETLASLVKLFGEGALRPPAPINAMPIGRIEDAFRLIASRKHTGKIVLESPEDAAVTAVTAAAPALDLARDGTYVIAGGLGDMGKRLAAFMSAHGAGHVVLLSRRSISSEEHMALQGRCGSGCFVHVVKCDVTKEPDVLRCVEFCRQRDLPPVRGVVHAAMVLQDRPFTAMSRGGFVTALGPKVFGTINLDKAFASPQLDFFLTLSSVANHIGNGSQANYAAGNEFQDAFARAHGSGNNKNSNKTHYISINLGAVAGSDSVKKSSSTNRLEVITVSFDDVFRSIEYAMSPQSHLDQCSQSIMGLSRASMVEADEHVCLTNPLFSQLPYPARTGQESAGEGSSGKAVDVEAALRNAHTIQEAEAIITETIVAKCAVFLDQSVDEVPVNQPLATIGLDSLVSIELKNWLLRAFQATVQTSNISSAPSVKALASLVAARSKIISDELRAATAETAQVAEGAAALDKTTVPFHGLECCKAAKMLPKYPLPDLKEILAYLEQNVSHFAKTPEELKGLRKAVDDFTAPGSLGLQMYDQLAQRAKDPELDSWLAEMHLKGLYLSRRHPIAPWGNFLNTHRDSPKPHTQAERAALVSRVAFQFATEVATRKLDADWLGNQPLCTYSWDWMFNTVREPHPGCDKMQRHPGNDYCAVLRRGHVFTVPLRQNGEEASYESLRTAFQSILDRRDLGEDSWAGMLTTDFRDPWAANRAALLAFGPSNKAYLEAIEAAAFLVCLDDGSPETNEERVRQCYVGSGFNRWHDKSTQFLISANGRSAQLSEHSMVDGLTIIRMTERIHDAIQSHDTTVAEAAAAAARNGSGSSRSDPLPVAQFTLQTTPDMESHINGLREAYASHTAKKRYALHTVRSLGTSAALGTGVSAKGCMDLAIQLANRMHFGHNPGSWEPVSTQHFHRGRPELVQVVTGSVVEFCEAALLAKGSGGHYDRARQLLCKAAGEWEQQVRRAGEGRAFLRMWDTLLGMVPEGAEKPAIFTDPVFWRAFPGSVLQVRNEAEVEDAAICLWDEDALWMSYSIREGCVNVSIVGDVGKVEAYRQCLDRAGDLVRSIVRGGR